MQYKYKYKYRHIDGKLRCS